MKQMLVKEDAVYAFIQARFNSRRLTGKVLKTLIDRSLLAWSVERAGKINPNVNVVVLTGDCPENDKIVDWCKENKVLYYQGSEENVLNRFRLAAEKYRAKTIIRLTADNPLVDFKNAFALLSQHLLEKAEYSSSKSEFGSGMPDGIGVEIFDSMLLFQLDDMKLTSLHREHVNNYILENNHKYRCSLLRITEDFSEYRFTVDTKEDYDRVRSWVSTCFPESVGESDYWRRVVKSRECNED